MVDITGIVLSYNNINTIKYCIESFEKFDEIIVLDSNSTDGTKEYLEKQNNVTLFVGPPIGNKWIPAHNSLIRECSTSHCFYLDSDELINIDFYDELKALWEKDPNIFPVTARATIIYKDRCKKERHPDPQFRSGPVNKLRYYNPSNTVHERLDANFTGDNPKLSKTKYIIIHIRDLNQEWCVKQLRWNQEKIRRSPGAMSLYDTYKVNTWDELLEVIKNLPTFPIKDLEKEGFILPKDSRLKEILNNEST